MITADEAHCISQLCQGQAFISAVAEQRNEIQKQMLALLTELVKKIPEPKKEGEQNNTNK